MRRAIAILGLALVTLGASAGSALAADPILPRPLPTHLLTAVGVEVPPAKDFRSGFTIKASHRYTVEVLTFGSAVVLEAVDGNGSTSAYMARGVGRPERLQATFGKFGEVKMRFRQSRHRTWFGKRRDCKGAQRFVVRRGVFVGNLRFEGEGGYVSVRVHRAPGAVQTIAAKCQRKEESTRRRRLAKQRDGLFLGLVSFLAALSRDGVDTTDFLTLGAARRAIFFAAHEESRGKLAIVRFAFGKGRAGFHVNEAATAASIGPPAPFHGTGRYRAAPDGTTTWSGDLSVNFPGTPRFPLTGPQFEAFLDTPF